jgi:hypothetical protein
VLNSEEYTVEIDRLLAPPIRKRQLRDISGNNHSCVIDEDVQTGKCAGDFGNNGNPIWFIGDIEMLKDCFPGRIGNLSCGLSSFVILNIGKNDFPTFRGKETGSLKSNAASCPRDQRYLAFEPCHC